MRKIFYFLIVIAGVTLLATPLSYLPIDKKIWIRIDSLEAEGLYRSALKMVDLVYNQAKGEADPETEIRALIYRLKYTQELEEDGQLAAIATLEKELPDERLVPGAIKYSMLAELYYRYYTANRWQISQNPMENKGAGQPLKNWSPERFYRIILDQYELSLRKEEQLWKVRVGSLPGLWTGNLADTINKPSLYDVLISRALDFLQNAGEFSLSSLKPAVFCSPELFSDADQFSKAVPEQEASGSNPYYRALKWYGAWLGKTDKLSLVAADLQRLRYIHEQSCNQFRDSLYESGLLRWSVQLGRDSSNTTVCEALAQYHLDRGNMFQINDSDTLKYKQERKLAADWLMKSKEWAATLAGKRCANLLNSLMKPELAVQSEACQIPLYTFPVSVEYRNLANLHYRILRMNALSYYSDWNDLEPAAKLIRINGLKVVKTGKIALPDDGNLNPHRANALIDPLPAGFYLMIFSNQENNLSPENLLVTVPVSVTRTTLVTGQDNSKGRDFYFRDRDNGSPLTGLVVVPWYSLYDQESRRSILEKGAKKSSGAEGFLEIPDGGPGRDDPSPKAYRLEIIDKKDTLVTHDLFYPGYNQGKTVARTSLMLYTDRKIYKPGDEACFRGVLIDYIGDSMAVHRTDSITLIFQDPRYQVVRQFVLPVDSLGVFAGSIKLPYKGLTGNYLIQSKFGQAAIRMEQYKRPAFSISILRGSDIFQPGDSMQISGMVKALSGEPVSGADILADVDLQPVFGPRRWSPFTGQKIRITTVKSTTNEKGIFTCKWVSIPDGSNPFGNGSMNRYSVNVRVTDLNGESHQEVTMIDSGKGTTSLSLNLPDRILSTDTLNGSIGAICSDGRAVKVPVVLKISKLKDPDRTWIEPVLPEPDRFIVNRSEWQKKMPELPYRNEHQPSAWAVTGVTSQTAYPNDTVEKIGIPPAGKWQKGWYKIELVPADQYMCKAATRYLYVEDPNSLSIDDNETLYARASHPEIKLDQILELDYACNPKGFLFVELQKLGGNPLTGWYSSEKKKNKLSWKVADDWQGGALIHLIMFRSNRVYEKNIQISIPWGNSELTISGFEKLNMVKPGDSIELNLLVKDEKGAPVRASVGITIYDASLDLIAPHFWPPVRKPFYTGGSSFEPLNYGISGSYTMFEPVINWIDIPYIEPVTLNWFGLGYYGISRMDAPMMKMAMAQPNGARGGQSRENLTNVEVGANLRS
ncbi:MAG: MG2 domain-containing protein, partial [Bacteroidia bacterium]|nr:MG2 domain-containing protein [Bacteroidia bacterium]